MVMLISDFIWFKKVNCVTPTNLSCTFQFNVILENILAHRCCFRVWVENVNAWEKKNYML